MSDYKTGAILRGHPPSLRSIETYATGALPTDLPLELASPPGAYPLLGNATYGDCTIAGLVHCNEAWNAITGEHDFIPDEVESVNRYFSLTGGADTGLVIANLLHEWYTAGNFHTKIKGYAPARNPRDMLLLQQIIEVFGVVYLGILCPNSAQEEFANEEPWTYKGERTPDGHCIVGTGWTKTGNLLCKTWGGEAEVTPGFIAHYFLEAYAIVADQFVQKGEDGRGVDLAGLTADLALVR